MATIRATCTVCGDVELGTADVRVRVDPTTNQGSYSFLCPRCGSLVVKPAQPRTIDLLLASGVHYDMATAPLELADTRPVPEPIAPSDIDAFADLLHDDGRLWAAFEDADSRR
jgi:predicted RNA-binding Zn-ribbon protein involved in translation (DUF1610 family)